MLSIFKKSIIVMALPSILFSLSACTTTGGNSIDNEGDVRRVGKVVWNTQADMDINSVLSNKVAANATRLVFIRQNDNYSEQTSANIAINNRYQVSLQSGNFTVVDACTGVNKLSAHATGYKENDLLAQEQNYNLAGGQTYFYVVNMDATGKSQLQQITDDSASSILEGKRYQAHQISRVVPDCTIAAKK